MNTLNRVMFLFCSATRRVLLAGTLLTPLSTIGQGIIYDQMSQGRADSLSSVDVIPMFLPLGQRFVPRAAALDFVELKVGAIKAGTEQTLALALHQTSIDRPAIGSTDPLIITFDPTPHPPQPLPIRTFRFPETVSLVPDTPYVFELVHLGGDYIAGATFWNASIFDAYPDGGMHIGGKVGKADLWFKTGYLIPEPSTMPLLTLGGALLLWGRRRRVG